MICCLCNSLTYTKSLFSKLSKDKFVAKQIYPNDFRLQFYFNSNVIKDNRKNTNDFCS